MKKFQNNQAMYNFPLDINFKIGTLSNDFIAKDATGNTVAYVRQKMFKLKEDILIYDGEAKKNVNFRIRANKWLDFSASYLFTDDQEVEIGRVTRKGIRSIWNATYEIYDAAQNHDYTISEENPWIKVLDAVLSEIPILGIFTGYLFNPTYLVKDSNNNVVAKLKKMQSFFGRKFQVQKTGDLGEAESRILLGLMMMILLERRRG